MKKQINFKKIALFLLLTFGLTWGFELLIALTITQSSYLKTGLHPAGMFFPAFSALILQIFIFKDSSIYYRTNKDKTLWIFYSFLILTVLNLLVNVLVLTTQIRVLILQGISGILVMLWTLNIFYLYGKCGPEGFRRVGLQLGKIDLGIRFILGVVLFLLSQIVLNWLFRLGKFPGILRNVGGIPVPEGLYPVACVAFFLISIIGIPLSGLATLFGEEYGWRGFLHDELVKLGPRPGVFLVGLIWSIWHFPIILSGVHSYPPTVNGLILGLLFFILAGFVLGYAVMKTHSIWVVSFMHGVLNSIYAFVLTYVFRPFDKDFSFGLGIYGLICLAGIVFLIFRDPVWNTQPDKLQKVQLLG
jgi:membrane protease YdiL (CAAX protease family)